MKLFSSYLRPIEVYRTIESLHAICRYKFNTPTRIIEGICDGSQIHPIMPSAHIEVDQTATADDEESLEKHLELFKSCVKEFRRRESF